MQQKIGTSPIPDTGQDIDTGQDDSRRPFLLLSQLPLPKGKDILPNANPPKEGIP